MADDAQITAYARDLPPIYRDILAAFPAIEPGRKAGYGLAFQTIAVHFANKHRSYSLGDVQQACQRLAAEGFIDVKNEIFAHPTDLGEKLIAAVTELPPAPAPSIPQLPARTW